MRYLTVFLTLFLTFSQCSNAQDKLIYGNAIIEKVHCCSSIEPLTISCDIKNYPPIIGKNITIIVPGITAIAEPNETKSQIIQDFVHKQLTEAKIIQLKNLKRSSIFAIEADIYFDKKSLSKLLVAKNYACPTDPNQVQPLKNIPITKNLKTENKKVYIVGSKNSKVFHKSSCHWTENISKQNRVRYKSRDDALSQDKRPCKACNP